MGPPSREQGHAAANLANLANLAKNTSAGATAKFGRTWQGRRSNRSACHSPFPRRPMTETERIRRLYDDRAATYDRSLGIVERIMLGRFRQAYGALLRGETIEVGVGSGLNIPFYSPDVTRLVGVDLSEEMLRHAHERAENLGIPFTLVQANAEALPFPDATFDTVAISLALCTIPDPAKALLELGRVCRPGGRIVMLEHVRSTARPLAALQRVLSPFNERAVGCHLDRDTFGLARSLGFSIDETQSRLFDAVQLVVAHPPAGAMLPSPDPIDAGGVKK
jgi:ubiquinone/menaquinone biosynthesis C-methylase UbiE